MAFIYRVANRVAHKSTEVSLPLASSLLASIFSVVDGEPAQLHRDIDIYVYDKSDFLRVLICMSAKRNLQGGLCLSVSVIELTIPFLPD